MDFVLKPSNSLSGGITAIARELIEKVKNAARITVPRAAAGCSERRAASPRRGAAARASRRDARSPRASSRGGNEYELVAIGTSTGGPVALKTVLTMLPGDLPVGMVVVQHMPPVFTKAFAERLDGCCEVSRQGSGERGCHHRPGASCWRRGTGT